MRKYSTSILVLFLSLIAHASPNYFTFNGYLTDSSNIPINGVHSISLVVQDGASCVLYSESHATVTITNGDFSVKVGTGASSTYYGGNTKLYQVFDTKNTAIAGSSCTSNGTTAAWYLGITVDATPMGNIAISSVPFAMTAENTNRIGGKPVTGTPNIGDILQYSAGQWVPTAFSETDPNVQSWAKNIPSADFLSSSPLTLAPYGTSGTYYKVTTDAKGRVTSGVTSLTPADITGLGNIAIINKNNNATDFLKGDGTWGPAGGTSLPTQTGNANKILTTDATNASWLGSSNGALLIGNVSNTWTTIGCGFNQILQWGAGGSTSCIATPSGSGTPGGSANQVQFNSAGTSFAGSPNFVWDNTNFRLGIGTTAPQAALQVGNGTDASIEGAQLFVSQSGEAVFGIRNNTNDVEAYFRTDGGQVDFGSYTAHNLTFWTADQHRMTIDSTGNVGIGTTSPTTALEVSGSVIGSFNSLSKVSATISQDENVGMMVVAKPSADNRSHYGAIYGTLDYSSFPTFNAPSNGGASAVMGEISYNSVDGTSQNSLQGVSGSVTVGGIGTTTGTLKRAEAVSARITAGGDAGTYSGNIYDATAVQAEVKAGSSFSGTITNAIGSSIYISTQSGSTISNAYGSKISINNNGAITNGYGLYIDNINATNKWAIYANDSGAPSYFAGNVGIGTTNPTATLDVNGSVKLGASGSVINNMIVCNITISGSVVSGNNTAEQSGTCAGATSSSVVYCSPTTTMTPKELTWSAYGSAGSVIIKFANPTIGGENPVTGWKCVVIN